MTFIPRPLEITERNSATITAASPTVRGMLANLINDAARNAKVYSSAAPEGSQERYDFAEAAFELEATAKRLGYRHTPEEAAAEAAAREATA